MYSQDVATVKAIRAQYCKPAQKTFSKAPTMRSVGDLNTSRTAQSVALKRTNTTNSIQTEMSGKFSLPLLVTSPKHFFGENTDDERRPKVNTFIYLQI